MLVGYRSLSECQIYETLIERAWWLANSTHAFAHVRRFCIGMVNELARCTAPCRSIWRVTQPIQSYPGIFWRVIAH